MQKIVYAFMALSLLFVAEKSFTQQDTEREKKEVEWVNPDIKAMEGLSHSTIHSKALGCEVGYSIWLPAEYTQKKKKRFPVLYFLHGIGGNESVDAAGFSTVVSEAIKEGLLPSVICVFPNGARSFYQGEVERMIIDDLIPAIDSKYRTIADARSRVLTGFSMGGFGAVYLSTMHPELFCFAGSIGGGLWRAGDEFWQVVESAVPVWKKNNYGFFFVNGDGDRPEAFNAFSATLDKYGIENQIMVLPETGHDLGKYYEESSVQLFKLLNKHLR